MSCRFQTDFIVCGIAPFKDMLLLMAYVVDDIDEIAHVTSSERNERKVLFRTFQDHRGLQVVKARTSSNLLPFLRY